MSTKIVKQNSNSANFYIPSYEYLEYLKATYINTGKLSIARIKASESVLETVFNFATEEDRLVYLQDPAVSQEHEKFLAHIEANNVNVEGDLQD
jgi:hypothetical protein